ncbi:MAG: sucrase ferredoxin [Nocardioidaceae bacterium]
MTVVRPADRAAEFSTSSDPGACSVRSESLDEPAYGTAAVARGWVALEQPGPWGRDAAAESHLDHGLGRELGARAAAGGGRFVLIRAAGAHPDDHHGRPRTVLVSCGLPGREWLLTGTVTDPRTLLELDVDAVTRGDRTAVLASVPGLVASPSPVFLVCTNGRRDVCCAVRGRPVARDAAAQRPGQVWETSHTGGHRFAPTGVLLPSGVTLARVTAPDVLAALDAAAQDELPAYLLGPRHDRGRSALSPTEQAAESAVRALTRTVGLNAVRVSETVDVSAGTRVRIDHGAFGEAAASTTVLVRRTLREPDRRVSCGKEPESQQVYVVDVPGDLP